MLVYKEHVTLRGEITPEIVSRLINKHTAGRSRHPDARFYMTEVNPGEIVLCQVTEPGCDPERNLREYLDKLGVPYGKIRREQIGISDFANSVNHASQDDLCPAMREVLGPLHMMAYACEPFSHWITEAVFSGVPAAAKLKKGCAALHSNSLTAEAERILAGAGQPFRGHPVLYSIVTGSRKKNEDITELLLPLLHAAGRLPANRVCYLNPMEHPMPEFVLNDIFASQGGAAIVIDLHSDSEEHEESELLEPIARLAREYRGEVLTVFRTSADDTPALEKLRELTRDLPVLPITEDPLSRAETARTLAAMARKAGLGRVSFAKLLPEDKASYTEQEAEDFFHCWHDEYLTTNAYPQYAGALPEKTAPQPSGGTALDELEALVGLTEVKRIVRQAVDYARMQELCRAEGLPTEPPHLHMVFTGNPGTAKTTVARLVARIFKECGVLSKGELVEVGRGDLIGKYVGWTAKLVQEKFHAAEGSVLFIDEAYSLLDDHENQFGDEAINAIVQEMENRRDSTVVIFAGYKEPMQRFLDRNAGLRSRVSYQIDFPDYSEDELTEILYQQLTAKGRKLSPAAAAKVRTLLCSGMEDRRFGNGRYARSMVENAMLAQASRLAALPRAELDRETLQTLTAEDFREKQKEETAQPRVIGFCA